MIYFSFCKNRFSCNFSGSTSAAAKSSTLPLPHQRPTISNREQRDRERDGYYSGKYKSLTFV